MYKGRNPSPPREYEDFNYKSSANSKLLFLKPTTHFCTPVELPPLNYFREALMRSKLVSRVLRERKSDTKPISKPPEVLNDIKAKSFEDSEENSMDYLYLSSPSYKLAEESEIPVVISQRRRETEIISDSKIKEIDTQKLMSVMSLAEVCQEDKFSKALSKDIELRSKLHDRKEELRGPELPKHCPRRNRQDGYQSDSPKNKTLERKEDLSDPRKHKSLRRKRDEDYLVEYQYRRCKTKSFRSGQGNYSSDESGYSHRSNRNHKRSKSKDSVMSRKRSDRKSSRRHSDSDSDGSVKIISLKTRRETTPKTKKVLMDEDSGKEPCSKKVIKSEEKEKPKKKADSPDQVKKSSKSVQHDPVVDEDPYFDDIELAAGVFGGSETFYCKVCQLNLNGIACYETHMNGKKHKKALNAQLLRPEALLYQVIGSHSRDPSFMQGLNRNVKMTKSNERARFQSTIDTYFENPLPGLNYIDEIQAKDGINYYCELCEAPCMPSSILPHLLGFKHYMNFLKIIEPSYYERVKDRPRKEIERQVKNKLRDHERKFGRKELTVVKCQVDSRGFPADNPCPSQRLPFREENLTLDTCAVVDDYGDFYCKICDAHMNNESMFHAHMVGKRHLKNEKKYSSGQGTSLSSSGKVRAPPNTPSELERMLRDVREPVVGLNFMRETQNPNGEYYTCFICGCCATTDVIDHIISMKHRIKFLETVNENKSIPNSIGNIRELEVGTQVREALVADSCREIEEKYGRGRVEVYI